MKEMTSPHLGHILLARRRLQVLPTLKPEQHTKTEFLGDSIPLSTPSLLSFLFLKKLANVELINLLKKSIIKWIFSFEKTLTHHLFFNFQRNFCYNFFVSLIFSLHCCVVRECCLHGTSPLKCAELASWPIKWSIFMNVLCTWKKCVV